MPGFIIALAITMMILPGQTSSINCEDNKYKYCNDKCRTDPRSIVCKMCNVWKGTGEFINALSSKVDGGLSKWEPDGLCSVTCGKGTRIYKRMCNNPIPENGGKACTGPLEETRECLMKPCPVDGGLSKWEAEGFCSVTCGKGTRMFKRTCNNPTPENERKDCTGPLEETRECLMKPCPAEASLSSNYRKTGNSGRQCIDGNYKTYCISGLEIDPWLKIDLQRDMLIKSVKLVNYYKHYSDTSIRIIVTANNGSEKECGRNSEGGAKSTNTITITCVENIIGRYVILQLNRNGKKARVDMGEFEIDMETPSQ